MSHIYPKWTFRRMKAADGRIYRYSTQAGIQEVRIQDGPKEPMLCAECEVRLSVWEGAMAKAINSDGVFEDLKPENGALSVFRHLEYGPTRLYLLSLLYRADIAKHAFFAQVNLGPIHRERIRLLLVSGDPGPPERYGCIVAVPQLSGEDGTIERPQVSVSPDTVRFDGEVGLRIVRMYIDGVFLNFVVGSEECMERYCGTPAFIQPDGRIAVGVGDALDVGFIRDSLGATVAMQSDR
jgi:hypothetical protein